AAQTFHNNQMHDTLLSSQTSHALEVHPCELFFPLVAVRFGRGAKALVLIDRLPPGAGNPSLA
ncbi:hypothetical protein, partial [Nocardioides ultimimeridianus]